MDTNTLILLIVAVGIFACYALIKFTFFIIDLIKNHRKRTTATKNESHIKSTKKYNRQSIKGEIKMRDKVYKYILLVIVYIIMYTPFSLLYISVFESGKGINIVYFILFAGVLCFVIYDLVKTHFELKYNINNN